MLKSVGLRKDPCGTPYGKMVSTKRVVYFDSLVSFRQITLYKF